MEKDPEGEYFTIGGCISPFNCPYQKEIPIYTSVTTGPSFTYSTDGGLSEE